MVVVLICGAYAVYAPLAYSLDEPHFLRRCALWHFVSPFDEYTLSEVCVAAITSSSLIRAWLHGLLLFYSQQHVSLLDSSLMKGSFAAINLSACALNSSLHMHGSDVADNDLHGYITSAALKIHQSTQRTVFSLKTSEV